MPNYIIIPARLESERLPEKMLLDVHGKPLVIRTWQACKKVKNVADVIIATDSDEIISAAKSYDAEWFLTGKEKCGTDRVRTVAEHLIEPEMIVNVQGDYPQINSRVLTNYLKGQKHLYSISTFCYQNKSLKIHNDKNCVKVVANAMGYALYFSRSPIPYCVNQENLVSVIHLGIYCYSLRVLQDLPSLSDPNVGDEKLEQLKWLIAGASIHCYLHPPIIGVDTEEDYRDLLKTTKASDWDV